MPFAWTTNEDGSGAHGSFDTVDEALAHARKTRKLGSTVLIGELCELRPSDYIPDDIDDVLEAMHEDLELDAQVLFIKPDKRDEAQKQLTNLFANWAETYITTTGLINKRGARNYVV